ncbi:hypothetical protein K1719_013140 [Acacia pycnantha]|nr:hypothetical protein K1719_013140 [Acacia pycnantha]
MSCSCTNCACGSNCNCGSKMYPDLSYAGEMISRESLVLGVAPMKMEGAEMGVAATENEGCKCGSNCTCDPCNCK